MEDAISDLLALIDNNYPHAKPTRNNEYAHIIDFKNRYLSSMNESEIEQFLVDTLNELESDPRIFNSFFWLADRFLPAFRFNTQEILDSGLVKRNESALKKYARSRHG